MHRCRYAWAALDLAVRQASDPVRRAARGERGARGPNAVGSVEAPWRLHADVLLCAFVNAGTGVLPFAEDPGSGAGWPAAGAARLAGSSGASGHAHLAPRFSPRGHPLWYAGTRAVTYVPSPTSDPEPRTDRMPGSSLSADRRPHANAVVFFPHRKAWLFLFRSAQAPRNASRNSSRDRQGEATRPAAG